MRVSDGGRCSWSAAVLWPPSGAEAARTAARRWPTESPWSRRGRGGAGRGWGVEFGGALQIDASRVDLPSAGAAGDKKILRLRRK